MEKKIDLKYNENIEIAKQIRNSLNKGKKKTYIISSNIYALLIMLSFVLISLGTDDGNSRKYNYEIINDMNDLVGIDIIVFFRIMVVVALVLISIVYFKLLWNYIFNNKFNEISFVDTFALNHYTIIDKEKFNVCVDEKSGKDYIEYELQGKKYRSENVIGNTIEELKKGCSKIIIVQRANERYEIAMTIAPNSIQNMCC